MAQIGQMYYRIPSSSGYLTAQVKSGVDFNPYSDLIAQIGSAGTTQLTKVGVQAPPGTQMVLNQLKQIMIGRTGIYELDEDIAITELYFIQPQNYERDTTAEEQAKTEGQEGIEEAMTNRETAYLIWTSPDGDAANGYANSWLEIQEQLDTYTKLLVDTQAALLNEQVLLKRLQDELATMDPTHSDYQQKEKEIAAAEQAIAKMSSDIDGYNTRLEILKACSENKAKMQEIEDTYLAAYTVARARYYEGVNGIYIAGDPGDLENVIIDYIME